MASLINYELFPVADPLFERAVTLAAEAFMVECSEIISQSRQHPLPDARSIIMDILRRDGRTLKAIGHKFGDRDHSTVMHSLDKCKDQIFLEPSFRRKYEFVINNIGGTN
jgi:chromosomal replication initiator protein